MMCLVVATLAWGLLFQASVPIARFCCVRMCRGHQGSAREPGAGSASASSGSGLTVSPGYHPLRSRSGGDNLRAYDAFVADLRAGVIEGTEEEREYFMPQGMMDRLAMQESLSDSARRRRKRKQEDETAELDDSADVAGSSSSSRRGDDPEGGGQGAAGEGCPLA